MADSKLIALESKTPKISKSVAAAEDQLKQAQALFKTMHEDEEKFQKKKAEEVGGGIVGSERYIRDNLFVLTMYFDDFKLAGPAEIFPRSGTC